MNDKELVQAANELARKFYNDLGYKQKDDFKFYEATHPAERSVWNMAVIAYEHISFTDIDDAVAGRVDALVMCESITIPTSRKYQRTQFSTIKKRAGKESVPFLGLDAGVHRVRFFNEKKSSVLTIKTWISPYGWAWKVLSA